MNQTEDPFYTSTKHEALGIDALGYIRLKCPNKIGERWCAVPQPNGLYRKCSACADNVESICREFEARRANQGMPSLVSMLEAELRQAVVKQSRALLSLNEARTRFESAIEYVALVERRLNEARGEQSE